MTKRLPTIESLTASINEENSPYNVDNITPEDNIQKLHKLHSKDHNAVVYYDDGSDSWKDVPADTGKWGTNWKFGIKKDEESESTNEEKLVKGNELPENIKQDVLNAFIYRWTKENETQAKRLHGANAPTMALVSDEDWLRDHAFYLTNDGSRLSNKRKHAEPAYMAETIDEAILERNMNEAKGKTYKDGEKVLVALWDEQTGKFNNWDDAVLAKVVSDKGDEVELIYDDDHDQNVEKISKESIKGLKESCIHESSGTLPAELKKYAKDNDDEITDFEEYKGYYIIASKKFSKSKRTGIICKKQMKAVYDTDTWNDAKTWIDNSGINESKINENSKNELKDFLDESGIYGYTNQIHAIASGDTVPDSALEDIKDFLTDNNINKNVKIEDIVPNYSIPKLLDAYLGWNGIQGYTEDILDIYGVDYERGDLFESKKTGKILLLEGIEYDTVTAFTPEEKAAKITEIATKHGVGEDVVIAAMEKGREIEFEHADNPDIADTIALHHLIEFIDYYDEDTGLPNMEKNLKGETEDE